MRKSVLMFLAILSVMIVAGKLDGKVIVIDPGHGGPDDRGAVTENLEEAVINLKVAFYLREMLEKEGAIVLMTRAADTAISLRRRVDLANKLDADLFLCLHQNYMETNRKADFSIVYFPSRTMDYSINLAHILAEKFEEYVGTKPGDIGPGDVYVMRNIRVPAILGEPCLMSNPEREKWLMNDENLKKEAKAYRDAVIELFSKPIPKLSMSADIVGERFEVYSDVPLEKAGAFLGVKQLSVTLKSSTTLIVNIPGDISPGDYELYVYGISEDGVYSKSLRKFVRYSPEPDEIDVSVYPDIAPAKAGSYFLIRIRAYHSDHPLEIEPVVQVDSGFVAFSNGDYIVPYMGFDDVELRVEFGTLVRKIQLKFQGKENVRVLFLEDEDGNPIGTLEYRGGREEIVVEGYKPVEYEAELVRPVSFETLVLSKTAEGKVAGKLIGVVFKPDQEDLAKSIEEILRGMNAEVILRVVETTRDEFKIAREFNKKVDAAILISLSNSKLEKFLRIPFIISSGTPEEIVNELLGILR